MLPGQNGIRRKYATFKLAPGIKKNTVYLSSYSPFDEGHPRTCTLFRKKVQQERFMLLLIRNKQYLQFISSLNMQMRFHDSGKYFKSINKDIVGWLDFGYA